MIKYNKKGKTDINLLDEQEAKIFVNFLNSERQRHLDDVMDIDILVNKLSIKYNL